MGFQYLGTVPADQRSAEVVAVPVVVAVPAVVVCLSVSLDLVQVCWGSQWCWWASSSTITAAIRPAQHKSCQSTALRCGRAEVAAPEPPEQRRAAERGWRQWQPPAGAAVVAAATSKNKRKSKSESDSESESWAEGRSKPNPLVASSY